MMQTTQIGGPAAPLPGQSAQSGQQGLDLFSALLANVNAHPAGTFSGQVAEGSPPDQPAADANERLLPPNANQEAAQTGPANANFVAAVAAQIMGMLGKGTGSQAISETPPQTSQTKTQIAPLPALLQDTTGFLEPLQKVPAQEFATIWQPINEGFGALAGLPAVPSPNDTGQPLDPSAGILATFNYAQAYPAPLIVINQALTSSAPVPANAVQTIELPYQIGSVPASEPNIGLGAEAADLAAQMGIITTGKPADERLDQAGRNNAAPAGWQFASWQGGPALADSVRQIMAGSASSPAIEAGLAAGTGAGHSVPAFEALASHSQPGQYPSWFQSLEDEPFSPGGVEEAGAIGLRVSHAMAPERGGYGPAQAAAPLTPQPISLQIFQAMDGRAGRFEIQLTPEELGKVEIAMEFDGEHRAQVKILVERSETFDLLSRDQRQLERMLGAQGLQLDGGIQLGLRDQQERQSHGQASDQGRGGGTQRGSGIENEASSVPVAVSNPLIRGNGLFDVTI